MAVRPSRRGTGIKGCAHLIAGTSGVEREMGAPLSLRWDFLGPGSPPAGLVAFVENDPEEMAFLN